MSQGIQGNNQMVPDLRFNLYTSNWDNIRLSTFLKVKHGFAFKGQYFDTSGKYILVTPGNFNPSGGFRYQGDKEKYYTNENFPKEYILKKGDVLTAMTEQAKGLIGSIIEIPESNKFLHNQRLGLFVLSDSINSRFLNYLFQKSSIRNKLSNHSAGTKVRHISPNEIESIKVIIPKLKEQQKIANFLTYIDQRITLLKQKRAAFEQYKKGLMQKIFSQEIRFNVNGFTNTSVTGREGEVSANGCANAASAGRAGAAKDDDAIDYPDWEEKRLYELFDKSSKKNKGSLIQRVFTNSAINGIVNQMDYFDHSVANPNNLEGYYIVENDDFIYNPRISQMAPVGPLKRNHLDTGVMSPLYTVLKPKSGNKTFLEYFFETTYWHRYMCCIANYGARHDRMNVLSNDFMSMSIPYPCPEEQKKIAVCLTAIDQSINQLSKQIDQSTQFKKGLLQRMFV